MGLSTISCGDDGSSPIEASTTENATEGTSGTSHTSSASTSEPSTSSPSTSSPSTTDATSDSIGPVDTSGDESSTGDPLLCGLSENPDEPGAWFELENANNPVETGSIVALECGGQGSLMFYLRSTQGGFVPEGETAYFAVTMDVEGFDDLSPTGHFFQDLNYGVGVGCAGDDENEGGFSLAGIAVLPPDALTDISMIDGLPATLHVELLPPGEDPVVLDAEVTLMVDPSLTIDNCGFG